MSNLENRYLYSPIMESGSLLPNIRSVNDKTPFIQSTSSGNYNFYYAMGGNWVKLNTGSDDEARFKKIGIGLATTDEIIYDITLKNKGQFANPSYSSGDFKFDGVGYLLDYDNTFSGKSYFEVDNMLVRGNLTVYDFLVIQKRFTNGSLFISNGAKIESVNGTTIVFEDPSSSDVCPFAVNDMILTKRYKPDGVTVLRTAEATINTVSGRTITITYNSGTFLAGDDVVRVGNTTDTNRQGMVYLTADDIGSPYIDVTNGVNDWSIWSGVGKTKARFGRLNEVVDSTFNPISPYKLSGYGLYADNVYLKGKFQISSNSDIIGLTIPTATYTSGTAFPISPAQGDWHFYTKSPPDSPYLKNCWYRYSGTVWVQMGLTGTYIDGTGIYTGSIVANQITTGTLNVVLTMSSGGSLTVGNGSAQHIVLDGSANSMTFYNSDNNSCGSITGNKISTTPYIKADGNFWVTGDIQSNGSITGGNGFLVGLGKDIRFAESGGSYSLISANSGYVNISGLNSLGSPEGRTLTVAYLNVANSGVINGNTILTSSSLSGYATQSWVTGTALSGYATQTWVQGTGVISFGDLNDVPSSFTPSSHGNEKHSSTFATGAWGTTGSYYLSDIDYNVETVQLTINGTTYTLVSAIAK